MDPATHGPDEVRRIAALARLSLDDAEVEALARDFGRILAYVERLQAVADAADAEPLVHAVPPADPAATLRADAPVPWDDPSAPLAPGAVLGLAPDRAEPFVRVPRVLEEGR